MQECANLQASEAGLCRPRQAVCVTTSCRQSSVTHAARQAKTETIFPGPPHRWPRHRGVARQISRSPDLVLCRALKLAIRGPIFVRLLTDRSIELACAYGCLQIPLSLCLDAKILFTVSTLAPTKAIIAHTRFPGISLRADKIGNAFASVVGYRCDFVTLALRPRNARRTPSACPYARDSQAASLSREHARKRLLQLADFTMLSIFFQTFVQTFRTFVKSRTIPALFLAVSRVRFYRTLGVYKRQVCTRRSVHSPLRHIPSRRAALHASRHRHRHAHSHQQLREELARRRSPSITRRTMGSSLSFCGLGPSADERRLQQSSQPRYHHVR